MLGLNREDPRELGPYRLRAVIGDGGMGRVYLGTSPAGRAVAVKVIGPGLAEQPGYRQRFAREARAALAVSGVYTAAVVDADTEGPRPYIATEFVAAPSLADAVRTAGPLPPEAVFALAGGLAEALTAIHRAGLVHRDVKPHNILLAADGPVVIDFGIARGEEPSLTASGMTIGSPGYIAPEVLRGHDSTAASDVFSLACVLVYAARGVGPFGTGDPLAVAHRTVAEPPDLSGAPEKVRTLVAPLLAADPTLRPTPAQLLKQVSEVSGTAVLHGGTWLPADVRALLAQRQAEAQAILGEKASGDGQQGAAQGVPVAAPMPPARPAGPANPVPRTLPYTGSPGQAPAPTPTYAYPATQTAMPTGRGRGPMYAAVALVVVVIAVAAAIGFFDHSSTPGAAGANQSTSSHSPDGSPSAAAGSAGHGSTPQTSDTQTSDTQTTETQTTNSGTTSLAAFYVGRWTGVVNQYSSVGSPLGRADVELNITGWKQGQQVGTLTAGALGFVGCTGDVTLTGTTSDGSASLFGRGTSGTCVQFVIDLAKTGSSSVSYRTYAPSAPDITVESGTLTRS